MAHFSPWQDSLDNCQVASVEWCLARIKLLVSRGDAGIPIDGDEGRGGVKKQTCSYPIQRWNSCWTGEAGGQWQLGKRPAEGDVAGRPHAGR